MATDSRFTVTPQQRMRSASEIALLPLPGMEPPKTPPPPTRIPPKPGNTTLKDPAPSSCEQTLTLSFFFDGTGNNLDADIGTWEHSNVARLYRSHFEDDKGTGRYRFYLPGIGTLFMDREAQDPGGGPLDSAFGAQGQARLNWALARLREKVHEAEQRAQNPTNKINWIKVSIFGFSRGAALARAFARELQKLCKPDASSSTGWRLTPGGHPIEIVFLGLWDTVAAAGVPPSANNALRNRYAQVAARPARTVVKLARGATFDEAAQTLELKQLAFGATDAGSATSVADGHAAWANGLVIGGLVKRCVHMMAGHEIRNSFPVDSVLHETSPGRFTMPKATDEWVYPGVHSDVGGGYRPGEGGRRSEKGAQLSLLSLRAMHELALQAGVKLRPLAALEDQAQRDDFALDGPLAVQYAKTLSLWQHYLAQRKTYSVPGAASGLGGEMVKHMRVYYAWRFRSIRLAQAAEQEGRTTPQQDQVAQHEAGFAADRKRLDREYQASCKDLLQARSRQRQAWEALAQAERSQARLGTPVNPALVRMHDQAKDAAEQKQQENDRLRARIDTAANDSKLNTAIAKYDQMLYDDAVRIVNWMREDEINAEIADLTAQLSREEMRRNSEHAKLSMSGQGIDPATLLTTPQGERLRQNINDRYEPRIQAFKARIDDLTIRKKSRAGPHADHYLSKLTPHYRALVDAYLDEFERGLGMKDEKLIAFFDGYVHDSLARFDLDQTWPSDPRIVYVGGDRKLHFARPEQLAVET